MTEPHAAGRRRLDPQDRPTPRATPRRTPNADPLEAPACGARTQAGTRSADHPRPPAPERRAAEAADARAAEPTSRRRPSRRRPKRRVARAATTTAARRLRPRGSPSRPPSPPRWPRPPPEPRSGRGSLRWPRPCAPPASATRSRSPARASSASSRRSATRGSASWRPATRARAAFMAEAYGQLTGRPAACLGDARGRGGEPRDRHPHRLGRTRPRCSRSSARSSARCAAARPSRRSTRSSRSGGSRSGAPEPRIRRGVAAARRGGRSARRWAAGPGPVLLSLPEDLLDESVPAETSGRDRSRPPPRATDDEDVRAVLQLLAAARAAA